MPAQPPPGAAPLSYAQLKGVWLSAAAGTKYATDTWATLMAAIAEAESRGDPTAQNLNDNGGTQTSWGLWQISNGTHTAPDPGWADPYTNAKLAIAKLNGQGLGAWGTYTSGAYKAFMSSSTTATTAGVVVPPAGQVTVPTSVAGGGSDLTCAWKIGWGGIPGTSIFMDIFGSGGNVGSGEVCLLAKSQARAVIGTVMFFGGALLLLTGISWATGITGGIYALAPSLPKAESVIGAAGGKKGTGKPAASEAAAEVPVAA